MKNTIIVAEVQFFFICVCTIMCRDVRNSSDSFLLSTVISNIALRKLSNSYFTVTLPATRSLDEHAECSHAHARALEARLMYLVILDTHS